MKKMYPEDVARLASINGLTLQSEDLEDVTCRLNVMLTAINQLSSTRSIVEKLPPFLALEQFQSLND